MVVLFWLELWEIFFLPTQGLQLGTSGSLALHSTTVPHCNFWFSPLTISGIEKSGAKGLVVVLFWLDLWDFLFLPTPGLEMGTSGSLVLHSTTVPQWFLVFTSKIGGCIVLTWPLRDFFFSHTWVWTGDLWISSPALYHWVTATSCFHLWHFQVLKSGAEGLVMALFWLDLWKIFFLPTPGFELGTSGSLVLHSTTVPG